jgi:hypothetical protein
MEVDKIFSLADRRRLIVHIHSFDWDFSDFGPVLLQLGKVLIPCDYVASGNSNGVPALELIPRMPCQYSVDEISRMAGRAGGPITLARDVPRK